MSSATARIFHDEAAAYQLIEQVVWPQGPVCPHCGRSDRIGKMGGQSTRPGTYKCYGCRKPFTVKIGTLAESSHVPLHVWLRAIYLMSCSSGHVGLPELRRSTGVTLKTAWFMADRIRRATGSVPANTRLSRGQAAPAARTPELPDKGRSNSIAPVS